MNRPTAPAAGSTQSLPDGATHGLQGRTSAVDTGDAPTAQAAPQPQARQDGLRVGDDAAYQRAVAYAQASARRQQAELAEERAAARSEELAEARALAIAEANLAPPRRDLRPTDPRKGLRLGALHAGQVVTWEAAVLASLASYRYAMAWFLPVSVVSVIAIALTTVRIAGRWAYEWCGIALRYLFRRRSSTLDQGGGLLSAARRGAELSSLEINDREVGLVTHADGFSLILGVDTPTQDGKRVSRIELPDVIDLMPAAESADPPVSLQVVVHTVPAPGLRAANDIVAKSYSELTAGEVPAQRRVWIALQAMHTADSFTASDMRIALINAVRRTERKLAKAGMQVTPLPPADIGDDFAALLDPMSDRAETIAEESWGAYGSTNCVHVSYRIKNWPDLGLEAGANLVQRLATLPVQSSTVAVGVRRVSSDTSEVECVLRLVVPSVAAIAPAERMLAELAELVDAQFERLDGEQAFGVHASLPLGGFAG